MYTYHEIIHVKQANMVDGYSSENKEIDEIIKKNLYLQYINPLLYEDKHNLFLTEYNANITSAILTDLFYDEVISHSTKSFNKGLNLCINYYYGNGYNKTSPLEEYNKISNQNILPVNNLDTFDKLCYGMPLSNEEKNKVKTLGLAKQNGINVINYLKNIKSSQN